MSRGLSVRNSPRALWQYTIVYIYYIYSHIDYGTKVLKYANAIGERSNYYNRFTITRPKYYNA